MEQFSLEFGGQCERLMGTIVPVEYLHVGVVDGDFGALVVHLDLTYPPVSRIHLDLAEWYGVVERSWRVDVSLLKFHILL